MATALKRNETVKKTVRKSKPVEEKDARKLEKKSADDLGFEISTGVPDSEYFTFENRSLNALFSTMFGTPGIMKGKIIEIAGKSDVGKTALSTTLTAYAQAQGVRGFHIDAEKSLTKEFASHLKLDTQKLLLVRPDHGEGAMMGLRKVVREYGGMFGVLDSSTACLPKDETNDKGGGMGAQARMMSQEMKKVDKVIDKAKAILIIISQIKTKPGVTFGNPDYVSSGGSAVGFHSRIRMIVSKVEVEKDESTKQEVGFTVRATITKNHTGPKRTTPFDLRVDHMFRIDLAKTALAWAKQFKLLNKEAKEVCGIKLDKTFDKDIEAALSGKEYLVFEAVDALFKAREAGGGNTFTEQDDSTDELAGTDDEGFNEIKVGDDELENDDGDL